MVKDLTSVFALLGGGPTSREGLIVFSADGSSGSVCELKSGKPSEFYSISKSP